MEEPLEPLRMKYPNRLYELRAERGLTQAEAAKLLNMKQPTLSRHEKGNRNLDAVSIERYAQFYGITPYELFVPPDWAIEYAFVSDEEPSLTKG